MPRTMGFFNDFRHIRLGIGDTVATNVGTLDKLVECTVVGYSAKKIKLSYQENATTIKIIDKFPAQVALLTKKVGNRLARKDEIDSVVE